MDSNNLDQSADQPSTILIPVDVGHVDQLVAIARDLAGIVLILDAAATGDPTYAAIERIVAPINEQLQEFKSWFHNALRTAAPGKTEHEK